MKTKKCSKCKTFIDVDQFHSHKGKRDGLTSWCKTCLNEKSKLRFLNSQKSVVKYSPSYQRKIHENPTRRYQVLLDKCIKKQYDCDLSLLDYTKLIEQDCYYCLMPLKHMTGISLDRIDNSKGYTSKNVVPCCGSCNILRGNRLSLEETEKIIKILQIERDKLFIWDQNSSY